MLTWEEIQEKLEKLTPKYQKVCWLLAEGHSQRRTANKVGLTQPRISQLINHDLQFREALDALSEYVGLASRAARLRLAQRAALQFEDEDGNLELQKSLLDWLRFIRELMGEDLTRLRIEEVRYEEPKTMKELMDSLD